MKHPAEHPRTDTGAMAETMKPAEIKVVAGGEPAAQPIRRQDFPLIRWAAILLTIFLAYQLILVAGSLLLKLLPVLLLVVFAALLAFLLAPLVKGLVRVGLPRTLAALTVYLAILLLLAGAVSALSGAASRQLASLVEQYPTYVSQLQDWLGSIDNWLIRNGLPSLNLRDLAGSFFASGPRGLLTGAVGIVTTVAGSLLNVVLVFVIGFYLLRDGERIKSRLRNLLPEGTRSRYDFATEALAFVVGGYVRAQVTMALIIGALAGVGCWFLGVHYSVVIGLTVGLLELIPIFGALIGSLLAIGIASLQDLHLALLVIGYFIIIHFLEAYVLGPRITGVRVDLHPLIALLSMLVGVEVAGLIGALFAVPVAGLANVFVRAFYWDLRAKNPSTFGAAPAAAAAAGGGWRRAWAQLRRRKAEKKIP
jgi:predicted PurR-regulated permease PerM